MRPIQRADFEALLHHEAPHSISVLMPTQRAGPEVRQNPIRFKNLLGEVAEQLAAAGLRGPDAEARLEPLRQLQADEGFWEHQRDGLAVFLGHEAPRAYRLPMPVEELAVVGPRFHLVPLLPLLNQDGRFYILALSQSSVRLFAATRHDVRALPLEDAPASFQEAMRFLDAERHVQFHTGTPSQGHGGQRPAIFHGQGDIADEANKKTRLLEYCQMIDRGVQKRLHKNKAPLVLVANEPLAGIYRQANTHANLCPHAVHATPDPMDPPALHAQAVHLLADWFRQDTEREVARYQQLAGGDRAGDRLETILPAARFHHVDSLLIARDEHCWGTFDPDRRETTIHPSRQPGDQDLLNLAAADTLLGGGKALTLPRAQMPEEALAAAVFRFPAP